MSAIGSLIVELGLNSASLKNGLKEAQSALSGFGSAAKEMSEKLRALTEMKSFELGKEVVKGLAEFIQKGAESAAQMGILAQAAGVPVEAFSRLSYAANLSGISTEDLSVAFNKLNKNLGLAATGVPAQAALFKALGVAVRDSSGQVKDGSVVMGELAEKFSGLKDGASKAALEMEVFGKSGAALTAFLNQGKKLQELGDEADRFGFTTGPAAAEAAHAFEQSLTKLQMAANSVGKEVAVQLAPALTTLTTELLNSKTGSLSLKEASDGLVVVLKTLATVGIFIGGVFEGIGATAGLAAAAVNAAAHGQFADALSFFEQKAKVLDEIGKATGDRIAAMWEKPNAAAGVAAAAIKSVLDATRKSADSILQNASAGAKGMTLAETALKSLTATVEEYETKAAEASATEGGWLEKMNAFLDTGKIAKELKEIGAAGDALRERLVTAFTAIHDAAAQKLSLKVDVDIAKVAAAVNQQVIERTTAYNNVGKSISQQDQTAGFASFDVAIKEFARQTELNARRIGAAELLRLNGDEAAARQMEGFAEEAKLAADSAGKAADAFKAGRESLLSSIEGLANTLASKMGNVGDVIQSAMAGFKSGGFIGAILGAIGAILTKLQGFTDIVASMNAYFGRWIEMVNKILKPLFDGIIRFAESIGSAAEMLTELSGTTEILYAVFFSLGKVLDVLTLGILYTAKFFADIAGGNKTIDDKIKDTLYDLTKQYHQVDPTTPPPLPTTTPAVDSINNLGDAAQKTADKFGELATNLPSWYKVGAAVFGAAGAAAGGGAGGALQGGGLGGSGGLLGTGDMGITIGPDGKPSLRSGLGFNAGDVLGGKDYSKAANSFAGWGNGSGQGTGGDTSSVGAHVGTMTAAEAATWAQIWQYSHAMGASDADAAAAADAWITSSRGGTGSSSGAATASSSGVTNIGSGGGGIQSTAPVENHFHFHEGSILPRDFGHFVEQVSEKQQQKAGQKSRNPVRTKGHG